MGKATKKAKKKNEWGLESKGEEDFFSELYYLKRKLEISDVHHSLTYNRRIEYIRELS